jgi:hypothetical protein
VSEEMGFELCRCYLESLIIKLDEILKEFENGAYFDFNQLFDSINNPNVLIPGRSLANHSLVTCTHPSSVAICIIEESFSIGFLVI